jgi:hypothetical protein
VVDTVPPTISVPGAPDDGAILEPGVELILQELPLCDDNATFIWACDIEVDGIPQFWEPIVLPTSLGQHVIKLTARDFAGNQTVRVQTYTIVANIPPETTIESGPSGVVADNTPTFEFSSNEAGSTFACRVDNGPPEPCASPHTTAALDDGEHTFFVTATDPHGGVDPTPASRTFTVDTTAPTIDIAVPQDGATFDDESVPAAEVSCDDAVSGVEECAVTNDGDPVPADRQLKGSVGEHTVHVVARDRAGNTAEASATYEVVRSKRKLTVELDGQGTGAVVSDPEGIVCGDDCEESFDRGTTVTLRAEAAEDSVFAGWSGEGVECAGTGPCEVTLDQARTVHATFDPKPRHTLTVRRDGTGTGSITIDPPGIECTEATCDEEYLEGTEVALRASAVDGTTFQGWEGCPEVDSETGECRVTMDRARTVTALFRQVPTYVLSVNLTGDGQGTVTSDPVGIVCEPDCEEPFRENTPIRLSADPSPGSTFAGWTGCDSVQGGDCVVQSTRDVTVSAKFDAPPKSVTLTASGDSFIRSVLDVFNEGGNYRLQSASVSLLGITLFRHRTLVKFPEVANPGGVKKARLVLNVFTTAGYPSNGKPVDAAPVTVPWTEGNGRVFEMLLQLQWPGTGAGVTWDCATDANIANLNPDCNPKWNGGTTGPVTAPAVNHTSSTKGEVAWDVTADVKAGRTSWLIRNRDEKLSAGAIYYSREGAQAVGNPAAAPRLIIVR